jgi:N utilization substance protein A
MAQMALRGAPVSNLAGLGEKTLQKLRDHGVETVEQLAQMTPDELTQIPGIGEKTVERIRRVVTDYFEQAEETSETVEEVPPAAVESPSPEAASEAVAVEAPIAEAPSEVPAEIEPAESGEGGETK